MMNCVKCGGVDAEIFYKCISVETGNPDKPYKLKDYLEKTCKTCGYYWETECLDALSSVEEQS